MGGGIGMGNTCKLIAVSFQCMTKFTTNKKKKKNGTWPSGNQVLILSPAVTIIRAQILISLSLSHPSYKTGNSTKWSQILELSSPKDWVSLGGMKMNKTHSLPSVSWATKTQKNRTMSCLVMLRNVEHQFSFISSRTFDNITPLSSQTKISVIHLFHGKNLILSRLLFFSWWPILSAWDELGVS